MIDETALLDYIDSQTSIYLDRVNECQSYYYDGKIDTYIEIANIISNMKGESNENHSIRRANRKTTP